MSCDQRTQSCDPGNEVKVLYTYETSPLELLEVVDGSHDAPSLTRHMAPTHAKVAHILTQTVHLRCAVM